MFNIFKSKKAKLPPPLEYHKVEKDDVVFEYTIKLTDYQGNIKTHIFKDSIAEHETYVSTRPVGIDRFTLGNLSYKPINLKYTYVKRALDVTSFLNSHDNIIIEDNGDYLSYNRRFIKTIEITK